MESTRQRILDMLVDHDAPMTVAELAAVIGVHRTAIGQHLHQLVEAGHVTAVPLPPQGRGRPSTAFVAVDPQPYRTLAGWLTAAAARQMSPREAGREVGHQLGEHTLADGDWVAAIEGAATRLGFKPARRDRGERIDLRLGHCPYADVAADDLAVVCQLHLGVVEGMAAKSSDITVEELRVGDPHRGGCRIVLRRVSG